LLDLKVQVCNF